MATAAPNVNASPGSWNRRIRRFNRAILNPILLGVADHFHGTYPAVVQHRGRVSGRPYRTPVVARPVEGGFVIPLPYGVDTDWCQNVRAARRFTLTRAGQTYEVGEPQVITAAEALPLVEASLRRKWQRFHIDDFLRVKTFDGAGSGNASGVQRD